MVVDIATRIYHISRDRLQEKFLQEAIEEWDESGEGSFDDFIYKVVLLKWTDMVWN